MPREGAILFSDLMAGSTRGGWSTRESGRAPLGSLDQAGQADWGGEAERRSVAQGQRMPLQHGSAGFPAHSQWLMDVQAGANSKG
jgi:hypothetical protein